MVHRYRSTLALCCGLLSLLTSVVLAAEFHRARSQGDDPCNM
jgi:hypothetical protein